MIFIFCQNVIVCAVSHVNKFHIATSVCCAFCSLGTWSLNESLNHKMCCLFLEIPILVSTWSDNNVFLWLDSTWISPVYRAGCSDEQRSASLQSPSRSCSWGPAASGEKGWSSALNPNECSFSLWLHRTTICAAKQGIQMLSKNTYIEVKMMSLCTDASLP